MVTWRQLPLKYMRNMYFPFLESSGRMALWSKGYISDASSYLGTSVVVGHFECWESAAYQALGWPKVTGGSAETSYNRAVGCQVLCKVHVSLSGHELLRAALVARNLPCRKFSGTPPAGKDGLLLGREREGRGVTWRRAYVSKGNGRGWTSVVHARVGTARTRSGCEGFGARGGFPRREYTPMQA